MSTNADNPLYRDDGAWSSCLIQEQLEWIRAHLCATNPQEFGSLQRIRVTQAIREAIRYIERGINP